MVLICRSRVTFVRFNTRQVLRRLCSRKRCTDGTIVEKIDSEQIHLWLAYLDEIRDSRRLAEYQLLLSQEELRQQLRFHFERDRHRYLVTRAMLRIVLSLYAAVPPLKWKFQVNDYGKPSIASELTAARGIEFNVSHADGLVALAITRERSIGVDVENVHARDVDIDLAERYFAPTEVQALRTTPREHQQHKFFEYWTLKESYIKARGMGLAIPLDQFSFGFGPDASIVLTANPSLGDRSDRWRFWQLQLTNDHVAAICVERSRVEHEAHVRVSKLGT